MGLLKSCLGKMGWTHYLSPVGTISTIKIHCDATHQCTILELDEVVGNGGQVESLRMLWIKTMTLA